MACRFGTVDCRFRVGGPGAGFVGGDIIADEPIRESGGGGAPLEGEGVRFLEVELPRGGNKMFDLSSGLGGLAVPCGDNELISEP